MNKYISPIFINDLLIRADIVHIISIRIKLQKKGKNFYALCPFHHEKTPSFTVNSEKQFYYCFGCGVHGNAINFLMKYNQYSFIDAVQELTVLYSLIIPSIDNMNDYNKKKNTIMMIYIES